jgi:YggT family protein
MAIAYNFVRAFFDLWSIAIVVRVFLTWFNVNPYNPIVRVLDQITEPILAPLRRIIPPLGMIDITPIVALILLQVVEQIILTIIVRFA